jgi:hypothetical protein
MRTALRCLQVKGAHSPGRGPPPGAPVLPAGFPANRGAPGGARAPLRPRTEPSPPVEAGPPARAVGGASAPTTLRTRPPGRAASKRTTRANLVCSSRPAAASGAATPPAAASKASGWLQHRASPWPGTSAADAWSLSPAGEVLAHGPRPELAVARGGPQGREGKGLCPA